MIRLMLTQPLSGYQSMAKLPSKLARLTEGEKARTDQNI
jgi:hypothetical protein